MNEPGSPSESDIIRDLQKIRDLEDKGILPITEQRSRERKYLALDKRLNELQQQESQNFGQKLEKLGIKLGKWSIEAPNPTEQLIKKLLPAVLAGAGLGFAAVNGMSVYRNLTEIPGLIDALEKQLTSLDILKNVFASDSGTKIVNINQISKNVELWRQGIQTAVDSLGSNITSAAKDAGETLLGTAGAGLVTAIGKPWQKLVSRADALTGKAAAGIGTLLQNVGHSLGNKNLTKGEVNG